MSARITPDIIEAAARAEWDRYRPDLDGGPWEGLTEAQREAWREGVEVVLAAAIPLVIPAIKAEALREAADWLDDMARGYRESAYLGAGSDLIARLRARANELEAGSLAAIQVNGPRLEKSGNNSSLRDRIAEAINGGPLPEPGCDWEADMYQTQAAAVIAALGLTEEPGHTFYGVNGPCEGVTPGPDPLGIQTPHYHRYVTEWEATP